MTDQTPIEAARKQIEALIEAARAGTLTLADLPARLEAVRAALDRTDADPAAAPAFDPEAWLREQAYFIGHAVHELRTPMTSIRGYSDMLSNAAMGPLTDMQKQFLETIRTNVRRMETLLTDVSDMNKLRAGTLKINPKMDMFKNIAGLLEKQAAPLAESHSTRLTLEIPGGLPILNTDGEMLAKALYKLVENAIRYQKPDAETREVVVRARAEDKALIVEVVDHGIGMTPEELDQLGTIYFRSENEVVRSFKGSGLGIPVAYGIIERLGGKIEVKSAPGEGTTFTVRLPAAALPGST
ncbi:MAG: sensor histidine kinase [Candidatus Flexifilum sp.]|jgi:signal transduction histidine kinase